MEHPYTRFNSGRSRENSPSDNGGKTIKSLTRLLEEYFIAL